MEHLKIFQSNLEVTIALSTFVFTKNNIGKNNERKSKINSNDMSVSNRYVCMS